jgi:hypothetical protein
LTVLRIRNVYRILNFIHPGYRIPDPTTAIKEKGGKILVLPLFVASNITKLKLILFLNWIQDPDPQHWLLDIFTLIDAERSDFYVRYRYPTRMLFLMNKIQKSPYSSKATFLWFLYTGKHRTVLLYVSPSLSSQNLLKFYIVKKIMLLIIFREVQTFFFAKNFATLILFYFLSP